MGEMTFEGNSDSEKEDMEEQGPSTCKRGYWKNLLLAQPLGKMHFQTVTGNHFQSFLCYGHL
jgi:hypothetical protein